MHGPVTPAKAGALALPGDPDTCRDDAKSGTLAGIARKAEHRAAMDLVDAVAVTREHGIEGDYKGRLRPGSTGRRQVTLIERADWTAAMAELGARIDWQERRVNLLVDGLDLPQRSGERLRIGADVMLEVTSECTPCSRMEEVAPGLERALTPDWRGGVCTRVVAEGRIAVGDAIRIEQ